jgi:DNA-3-methyladenine glycosylase
VTPRAALRARHEDFGAPLPREFYDRDPEQVARDLLGCVLECASPEGKAAGIIVETEAYLGPHDPACHAAAGLTNRTKWLFGPPGTAYVYFIYGVHWCANAVTREEGFGSAVLFRALEPIAGVDLMRQRRRVKRDRDLANGPGKLCEALGITGAVNGRSLAAPPLAVYSGAPVPRGSILTTPRIGITKAADWPLRFVLKDSAFASRRVS